MQPRRTEQPIPVIPDKLYFRIGEVARLLGVETHTLRFWETEFPQIRVAKGGTGQRLYRRGDVEVLLEIRQLLYVEGFTIPGARQHLSARARRGPPHTESAGTASKDLPKEREPGLLSIRSALRALSQQLAGTPGRAVEDRRGRAPESSRRRGLHLASLANGNGSETESGRNANPGKPAPAARDLFDGLDQD